MSKAEVLFDGKTLEEPENFQAFLQALGEASTKIKPEFMKKTPEDPLVLFGHKVTSIFNAVSQGGSAGIAMAWTQTTLVLMLVAQGRLTIRFVADQPVASDFNMSDIFSEVDDILKGKLP